MNGKNREHWFALNNEQALSQLKEDFWDVFLAKLRQAVESGALNEDALENDAMIVARCVLTITAESVAPRSPYGKEMLDLLRHFV